jgi:hypothetical protein
MIDAQPNVRTSRRDLVPSSALPLAYFGFAHVSLATALAILVVWPDLPGAYFLHPRMVAVVHLVTLGWISASILGAFYIVAPLALGMSFPARRTDWAAAVAFTTGTLGMVAHFWIGEYVAMAWSASFVMGALGWVGVRAVRGLAGAPVPWAIKLHVGLAFGNVMVAGLLGATIGLSPSRGFAGVSPLASTFAHAHLAAVGWALMMVVGLAYRLLPMILPAKPPAGRGLAASALLMEIGLVVLVASLFMDSGWSPAGACLIVLGLAHFVRNVRRVVRQRLPRPPALPARDWSAWQVHGAFLSLAVATMAGVSLTMWPAGSTWVSVAWIYGVAGLLGGLAQIVVGMQGRLVPLYAWYRAMEMRGGPPPRSSHALVSAPYARTICLLWTAGVPWLGAGLTTSHEPSIRGAALVLIAGVIIGQMYVRHLVRTARG